jgi:hypothetical protein
LRTNHNVCPPLAATPYADREFRPVHFELGTIQGCLNRHRLLALNHLLLRLTTHHREEEDDDDCQKGVSFLYF